MWKQLNRRKDAVRGMQKRNQRNERSVAGHQSNPKELPEKVVELGSGLERSQESISHGGAVVEPGDGWSSQEHDRKQQQRGEREDGIDIWNKWA